MHIRIEMRTLFFQQKYILGTQKDDIDDGTNFRLKRINRTRPHQSNAHKK